MSIEELGQPDFEHLLYVGVKPYKPSEFQETLKQIRSYQGASVQVLSSDAIAGKEHILAAFTLSARSWSNNRMVAHNPATEMLLFASGQRQIKCALEKVGINNQSKGWVIIAISNSRLVLKSLYDELMKIGRESEELIELTDGKIPILMEKFGITDKELSIAERLYGSKSAALKSLVLERVSLSELLR